MISIADLTRQPQYFADIGRLLIGAAKAYEEDVLERGGP